MRRPKLFRVLVPRRGGKGFFRYRPAWNPDGDFRYERAKAVERLLEKENAGTDVLVRVKHEEPSKQALIDRYLDGDLYADTNAPVAHEQALAELLYRIAIAAKNCGEVWHVNSGYRSYAEQQALYDLYIRGKGNLAAKPGTSRHEGGRAADVSGADGRPVGSSDRRRRACYDQGLHFPVPGEPWHIERA